MMRLFTFAVFAAVLAASASAQQFGQWSWDATIGAGQRRYESTVNGATLNDVEDQDMRLALSVNGFIVHPALAVFRVGIETAMTRYAQRAALDNRKLGYRADFRILPQSDYPLQFFLSRRRYDYTSRPEGASFLLQNTPDQTSSLGARFRVRRGLLGGLIVGTDRTVVDFVERSARSEKVARGFADWSRAGRRLQQHYRLERQSRDYGAIGYTLTDTVVNSDQSTLFGTWRWTAAANATRREITIRGRESGALDIARIQNRLFTAERGKTLWDFGWDAGYAGGANGGVQSHLLSARILREHKNGYAYQWTPFVSLGLQIADAFTVTSPQAGINASWTARRRGFDLGLSGGASYLVLEKSGDASESTSESRLGYSAGFSAGHGSSSRWRKEIELSLARNRFRVAGESVGDVPQFGTVIAGTGTEDIDRARLTVGRRWNGASVQMYSDWSQRRAEGVFTSQPFTSTSLTQSLQVSMRHLSLLFSGGESVVETTMDQKVRHLSGSAAWRPFRFLSLNTLYRRDRRETVFEPRIDGERIEGGMSVRLGEIYLNPQAFVATERLASGEERVNRGFTVSVSRQFGGWLPIVTAPQRRGVIR